MDLRELKALIALMCKTGLVELEIQDQESRVRLVRSPSSNVTEVSSRPPVAAHVPAPTPAASHAGSLGQEPELGPGQVLVRSPMVGTFYRAPSPDTAPFVNEGDVVKKGQPLCIIEAMKMMNEIAAEVAGKVSRILCENAQPIEYGQPLMVLDTQ
jgi:acetyl-CoA carboxylase biotin carboxyl carrier protein